MKKSHVTLYETRPGQPNGGTWAHWQIALAYAHYLDPKFYIWCNNLVLDRLSLVKQGDFPPPRSPTVVLFEQFAQMHDKLDSLEQRVHRRIDVLGQYSHDILLLTSAIREGQNGKRLDFTTRSCRIIRAVCADEPYGGNCPCCGENRVLDEDDLPIVGGAEYDHFYGSALNRPEHGWLICKACHNNFTHASPLLRIGKIPDFHKFQGLVLTRLADERNNKAS